MSEPRFSWTQPICTDCWNERSPARPHPSQLLVPEAEICVHCAAETQGGLYIRIDPNDAHYPSLTK